MTRDPPPPPLAGPFPSGYALTRICFLAQSSGTQIIIIIRCLFFILLKDSHFLLFLTCCRFKEGPFRLNVLPNSKVSIICPHVATLLAATDDILSDNERYENFWIVDKTSYHSCNVSKSIASNKILLKCDDPARLKFERMSFQSFSADSDLKFVPGKTYYFICEYQFHSALLIKLINCITTRESYMHRAASNQGTTVGRSMCIFRLIIIIIIV